MRHGKRFNHLGRTSTHRKALLSNMASSLILHKRISTTVAKAKELRKYVEPLITKSKSDDTHSRRVVFSYLQNKESVRELFDEVSEKIATRPGGYTRIIRTGSRVGDNAEMCMIELVDYNELLLEESGPKKPKTRRSRRGGKKSDEGVEVEAKGAEKEKSPAKSKSDKSEPVADKATGQKENVEVEASEQTDQIQEAEKVEEEAEEIKDSAAEENVEAKEEDSEAKDEDEPGEKKE